MKKKYFPNVLLFFTLMLFLYHGFGVQGYAVARAVSASMSMTMPLEDAMWGISIVSDGSDTGRDTPFDVFVSEVSSLKQNTRGRIIVSGTMSVREGKYSGNSDFVLETGISGYHVVSGNNEIQCDGKCNYIVDNASMEMTVTLLDKTNRSVLSNPLSVLFELPQGFRVKSRGWDGLGDDRYYGVELLPERQDSGLSFVKLRISPDGKSLTGMELGIVQSVSSVTEIDVTIDAFSFSWQDRGSFTPDLESLEQAGYFINDLR